MGLIGAFLKRVRPPEHDDEFFGRLIYMRMPKGRVSYWEAKRVLPPTGREVELFIDAPAQLAAPNNAQRSFFQEVARDYLSILSSVESILRPQFEEWIGKPMERSFEDEFTPTSFSIPVPSDVPPDWEISFDSTTDPNHLFSVRLHGRIARDVSIDG